MSALHTFICQRKCLAAFAYTHSAPTHLCRMFGCQSMFHALFKCLPLFIYTRKETDMQGVSLHMTLSCHNRYPNKAITVVTLPSLVTVLASRSPYPRDLVLMKVCTDAIMVLKLYLLGSVCCGDKLRVAAHTMYPAFLPNTENIRRMTELDISASVASGPARREI